jgi:Na+/H+ antiporter NhaD/arsenite permease-like protein
MIEWFNFALIPTLKLLMLMLTAGTIRISRLPEALGFIASSVKGNGFKFAWIAVVFMLTALFSNFMIIAALIPLILMMNLDNKSKTYLLGLTILAANCGSIILPLGSTSNVLLANKYQLSIWTFFNAMLIPWCVMALVTIFITAISPIIKPDEITKPQRIIRFDLILGAISIAICTLVLWYILSWWIGFIIVLVLALMAGKPTHIIKLREWLIPAGVLSILTIFLLLKSSIDFRISTIDSSFFSAIIASQIIGSLPTTMLFMGKSEFIGLAWGVNIGAIGFPIASLVTLFALRSARKSGQIVIEKNILYRIFISSLLIGTIILTSIIYLTI